MKERVKNMKATIDFENWKVELDNEAVKAIRFCYGLPVDLRIKPAVKKPTYGYGYPITI